MRRGIDTSEYQRKNHSAGEDGRSLVRCADSTTHAEIEEEKKRLIKRKEMRL